MPTRLQRAFTLIELLVVIAIVVLLIAVMLPSLSKARELSKRSVCLSNVRSISIGLRVYGNEYEERIPMIFGNSRQYNFDFWYGGSLAAPATYPSIYRGQGILYSLRLVPDPKAFRCPSEFEQPRFILGTANCPWPPIAGTSSESAYGVRPEVEALYSAAGYTSGYQKWPIISNPLSWPSSQLLSTTAAVDNGSFTLGVDFTRHLINKALIAEPLLPKFIDGRHKVGTNVGYTDGSASWIERTRFNTDLMRYPNFVYAATSSNYGKTAADYTQLRMWAEFDKQ